jgi:WXG100 family type VII secretion target
MASCGHALEDLTAQVERRVSLLQHGWHGAAADAQQLAHEEWELGLRQMRAALAELRDAAELARRNYGEAAESNTAMWARTR